MRYYRVEALCGHVGKGRCIRKEFGVAASNGKEAARICRTIPRVKHDFKEATLSVKEVSYIEFLALICQNRHDPYLAAKNIQEQRNSCLDLEIEYIDDYRIFSQYKKGHSRISRKTYENRHKPHDEVALEQYIWR